MVRRHRILLIISTLLVAGTCFGDIIYVDDGAPPGGDGLSWGTAYNYLQDGLAVAASGDEIRVSPGVFTPDQGAGLTPGDRSATFQLVNGVTLRGGYGGETTLSGDLVGDDEPGFTNNGENSYHVITSSGMDASAVLNGFTIIGGNANGPYPENAGAGMYNTSSSPTLTNCTFSSNTSSGGGGMYNDLSSPTVTNCTFSGNSAAPWGTYGGGISNWNSSPTLTNCVFSGNSAGSGGGGIKGGNGAIVNCAFTGNTAGNDGGGILGGNGTITNCMFTWNTVGNDGGGIAFSNGAITNCMFHGNSAGHRGGGIAGELSVVITNCTFNFNSANYGGGIAGELSVVLTNCTLSFNSANFGGGIAGELSVALTNCTLKGNSANSGGGMYNEFGSATLTNCILWGNTALTEPQIYNDGTITITYSAVQGGWGGTGNIGADPLFVIGGLRLLPGSPCIDAGDNTAVPSGVTIDRDGNARFVDHPGTADTGNGTAPIVDMGAYEYQFDGDNDGIEDLIDLAPGVYSNDFADAETTFGEIMTRGDQILIIMDEPDPYGVRVKTDSSGGSTPATVSFCGGTVNLNLGAGVDMVMSGCSVEIEVISGTVEIEFVAADGTVATTSLDAGNSLIAEQDTLTITAPSTNSDDVVVVVDGKVYTLAPGETKTFATIDIDPDTLNLKSKGKWITCYIELPEGLDVADIDVSTVELNGVQVQSHPTEVGDHDGDGVTDLMVKFDKAAVQATVEVGDKELITVTGELNDGTVFEGHDTIRVISSGKKE